MSSVVLMCVATYSVTVTDSGVAPQDLCNEVRSWLIQNWHYLLLLSHRWLFLKVLSLGLLCTHNSIFKHQHENSESLSSATNPKPKGIPSHCLLRQA